MSAPDLTCWTMIREAAQGNAEARERFARLYRSVALAALSSRWNGTPRMIWTEDAAQDVFVECFKSGGVLASADRRRGLFRPFFLAVVRNIARRYEERHRATIPLPEDTPEDDESLSRAFDRAWVHATLREAARVQEEQARGDDRAARRVELLRLRFQHGLPIRAIADRWGVEAGWLHHEYATAREEFRRALRRVMACHHPHAGPTELDAACRDLLQSV